MTEKRGDGRMPFDSDLAEERREASFKGGGVLFSENTLHGVKFTDIRITNKEGEEALGRPQGRYLTLSFDTLHLLLSEEREHLRDALADALAQMLPAFERILLLGLGNRYMCADAIGVLSAEGAMSDAKDTGVFCLAPGTKGQTGVEAATLARAAAEAVGADAVLAVDALAAREKERLFRAFEITDTGISPGTGVGNRSLPICEAEVGVKVLAIGVPTMMRASSFLKNALMKAGEKEKDAAGYAEAGEGLFTLPMHFEEDTKAIANLLSSAIRKAIQKKRGI